MTPADTSSLFAANVPGMTKILAQKTIAVAGCGGLGSNAAAALTRAGIGHLILADFDRVELSNLNRQYYFLADVGKPKTAALAAHLRGINPDITLTLHQLRLTPEKTSRLFSAADLLIEAFDSAEAKQWLIESWCAAFPDRPVIIGSGLAGLGATGSLKVEKYGQLYVCGDGSSGPERGLSSARVAIAANMQANTALALLTGLDEI